MGKILLAVTLIALVVVAVFVFGKGRPPGKEYPESPADVNGFEKKKTGANFTIYYHSGEETNANKTLAVLEQGGVDLYRKYLGLEPKNILVYLTADADEYVKIANFPGGKGHLEAGDGSAPNGKIYLYKPFQETGGNKSGGVIVHEGTHAVLYQFLGQDKIGSLPGFLNEGLAYYLEYIFKAGKNFSPLSEIYHSDLLVSGVKTGSPKLLDLAELAQKCNGYIFDETLNFLCRGQGVYSVWYINETYGDGVWGKILKDLKQTGNWQSSLQKATGKTIGQLGQDIKSRLESMVGQK